MELYINHLVRKAAEYRMEAANVMADGVENMNHEESETYGVFIGKAEQLEDMVEFLTKIAAKIAAKECDDISVKDLNTLFDENADDYIAPEEEKDEDD